MTKPETVTHPNFRLSLMRGVIFFVCERMKSLKFQCESFLVVGKPEKTLTQVAAGCVNGQPSRAAH